VVRLAASLTCCATVLALTGCAGVHLYDSERDRQGQAAKKAWSEVDLQAMIKVERANLDKLLAAELDAQDKLATAIRDQELRAMVRSDSVKTALVDPVDSRLGALAGTPDALAAFLQRRARFRTWKRDLAARQNIFAIKGAAAPDCASVASGATPRALQEWLKGQDATTRVVIDVSLKELRKKCSENLAEADVYKDVKGAIGEAWSEYQRAAAKLEADRTSVKGLQQAYASARADYDKAAASADPKESNQLAAAAARIDKAIAELEAKSASSPLAARLLAQEKIKAIADLAQAITESQPGQDASETGAALRVLSGLHDDVRTALASARKPLLLPLVIRKNHEELNLEAARRDIAASEQIVSLSRELVDALVAQAEQLALARTELSQPKVAELHARPFMDAFKGSGPREREALYGAAARYLDAVNRLEARRYKLEYKRVAAHHEKALAYAEVNARQWESLINSSVGQVAEYHASGFKPEQIAGYLNTLGLFYIGAGVNK
jgi:hypothetical protein